MESEKKTKGERLVDVIMLTDSYIKYSTLYKYKLPNETILTILAESYLKNCYIDLSFKVLDAAIGLMSYYKKIAMDCLKKQRNNVELEKLNALETKIKTVVLFFKTYGKREKTENKEKISFPICFGENEETSEFVRDGKLICEAYEQICENEIENWAKMKKEQEEKRKQIREEISKKKDFLKENLSK